MGRHYGARRRGAVVLAWGRHPRLFRRQISGNSEAVPLSLRRRTMLASQPPARFRRRAGAARARAGDGRPRRKPGIVAEGTVSLLFALIVRRVVENGAVPHEATLHRESLDEVTNVAAIRLHAHTPGPIDISSRCRANFAFFFPPWRRLWPPKRVRTSTSRPVCGLLALSSQSFSCKFTSNSKRGALRAGTVNVEPNLF